MTRPLNDPPRMGEGLGFAAGELTFDGLTHKGSAVLAIGQHRRDAIKSPSFEAGLHILRPKRRASHPGACIAYHFLRQGCIISHISY